MLALQRSTGELAVSLAESIGKIGMRRGITVLLVSVLWSIGVRAAPRTDVVVLLNGDHITGEVKQLFRGKLKFKTDNIKTIEIQWDKIATVESRQRLQVDLDSGERFFGSAEPSSEAGQLKLKDGPDAKIVSVPLLNVVQIYPIDEGVRLARFDGYVTGGYNYTKANNLQEFVFTAGLNTTQENHRWSVDASTAVTTQDGANDTQRL